jgi:apolipoprotein N-acyltransferase
LGAGLTRIFVAIIDREDFGYSLSRQLRKAGYLIAIAAALFCASSYHFSTPHKQQMVDVIQGNDKNRYLTENEIDTDYVAHSHIDLASHIDNHPDIIVFPESSFIQNPFDKSDTAPEMKSIAKKANELLILNANDETGKRKLNRNYFYTPDGTFVGDYDKKRLVPFGEYVPMSSWIGKWSLFNKIGNGYQPGDHDFTYKHVSSLICFESTFSDDVRHALRSDTRLLVITTNNRSYRRSGNSLQHLAQSRLRAIEFGVPVVHASISGPSAVISANGNMTTPSKMFTRSVISSSVIMQKPDSIYAKTFDWLSLSALVVVGCTSLVRLRKSSWKNRT